MPNHFRHSSQPNGWRPRLENSLATAWQRRGALAWCLWPASVLFGVVAAARRASFALGWPTPQRVGVAVVVVGNVTVGGTGKTPTVIGLVAALRREGFSPGVISRGYGARISTARPVLPNSTPQQVGDEPLLIARRAAVPVWVGHDRVAVARGLLAAHPEIDVLISDDGLQHYRLARDAELVVFDHRLGGNGFLLPAGPLREPLDRPRDATLINTAFADLLPPWPNTFRLTLHSGVAWQLNQPARRKPLNAFMGRKVLAAAGIGAPERFFAMLRGAGLVLTTRALPDHYAFARNPFVDTQADAILITEKDAVKCAAWDDARIWVIPVEAELDPRLIALIVEKVRGRSIA